MSPTICLLCGEMGVDAEHAKKCNAPSDLAAARAAIVELRAAHASALARAEAAEKERDEARAEMDEARAEAKRLDETNDRLLARADEYWREREGARAESASLRERVRALADKWEARADEPVRFNYSEQHAADSAESDAYGRCSEALRALLAPTKETTPAEPAKENDRG